MFNKLREENEWLKIALASEKSINRRHCEGWADTHTYCQELAKRVGIPEAKIYGDMYGDMYGVPNIEELVDMIVERLLVDMIVERLQGNKNEQ